MLWGIPPINQWGCFPAVRKKGLEPSRLAAQEPKSCVYTNFTTPADGQL